MSDEKRKILFATRRFSGRENSVMSYGNIRIKESSIDVLPRIADVGFGDKSILQISVTSRDGFTVRLFEEGYTPPFGEQEEQTPSQPEYEVWYKTNPKWTVHETGPDPAIRTALSKFPHAEFDLAGHVKWRLSRRNSRKMDRLRSIVHMALTKTDEEAVEGIYDLVTSEEWLKL